MSDDSGAHEFTRLYCTEFFTLFGCVLFPQDEISVLQKVAYNFLLCCTEVGPVRRVHQEALGGPSTQQLFLFNLSS